MATATHEQELARAFDAQAERFEQAKVIRDAESLVRLVAFAELPTGARVLDAGCGPGLVAEAFLAAGFEVAGVDLSGEMVKRAAARCARFGARARFSRQSLFEPVAGAPFDAALSRNVLHHVESAEAFVARQVALLRPGGRLLAQDLTTDPEPARAAAVGVVEQGRDRTHVRTLTPAEIVDLFARAGLRDLRLAEEEILLDFDEWFDRGSHGVPKEEVRGQVLALERAGARGFEPRLRPDGGIDILCLRAQVCGVLPG
jgi:2-polyprenyl-3-methyl-5-hydroxy-6-metoxy-1,4-benzoquinol methylase